MGATLGLRWESPVIPGRDVECITVGWRLETLLSRLGSTEELEASAKASGALIRRRESKSAEDLLRLALAYGPCGMSLRWSGGVGADDRVWASCRTWRLSIACAAARPGCRRS